MNKIICDICGTSYPDTADQCPICGYSRELNGDNILADTKPVEEVAETIREDAPVVPAPAPVQKPFLDEDDDDDYEEDDDEDYEDEDDDDDEEEEGRRSNTGLVVILVILIVALLAVIGFIAWRYFLPNLNLGKETTPSTAAPTESESTVATTEPTVPCTGLTMVSEGVVVLEEEGANWLINVAPSPENTTDKILYASSDESVVTVNEAGKLTAVGQGTAVITITCGEQLLQCNVTCFFIEETTEPVGTTAPAVFEDETTAPEEETTAPTEPEETTPATEPEETEPEETKKPETGSTVTLTLNKKDISFSIVPAYYTLEILEEGIDPEDVKWTSTDGGVCIVHNGKLQIVGWGTCKIYAEYNGVKAECIVRVVPR